MQTTSKPARRTGPARLAATLALLAALVSCAGVREARTLRDAQNAFDAGAAAEIAAVESDVGGGTGRRLSGALLANPRVHYVEARRILEGFDEASLARIKADGLLGTKLTLEALAAWKLGAAADAVRIAEAALREDVGARDRLVLIALPGVVIHDEEFGRVRAALTDGMTDGATLSRLARAAVLALAGEWEDASGPEAGTAAWHVERALNDPAAKGHPVRPVLIQWQLAILRTMQDIYGTVLGIAPPLNEVATAKAKERLLELREPLRGTWARLLGIVL